MKKEKNLTLYCLIVSIILFSNCGGEQQPAQKEDTGSTTAELTTAPSSTVNLIEIPAPLQVVSVIRGINPTYNAALLNPGDKTNYSTNYLRALNIGLYGIDWGYAMMFNQSQTAIRYLSAVKTLSNDLNILGTIDDDIIKKFERNLNNQDSMAIIILDSYNKIHKYLDNNDRKAVGSLVFAGGFVEGLYFACHATDKNPTQQIKNLVGIQKIYLKNILLFLTKYRTEETDNLIAQFEDLQKEFEPILVEFDGNETEKKLKDVEINEKQFTAIAQKITQIRKSITG